MSTHFAVCASARRIKVDLDQVIGGIIRRAGRLEATGSVRGVKIRQARRLRVEAENVVTLTVLEARERGATWHEIADWLGETLEFTRNRYLPIEIRYAQGLGIDPDVQPDD